MTFLSMNSPRAAPGRVVVRRALLMVCLVGAVLTGCALPDKPVRQTMYDFGPGALGGARPDVPAEAPPLMLADIQAPPALDGVAVLYRLAYANAQQLQPYAQARWSMPPAQLVQQRLREQLGQHGPVLNAGVAGATRELRIEVEEFSQIFESPAQSSGLVRLRATLMRTGAGSGRLLAQRSVVVRQPAPSADAPGGVRALKEATDAAVDDIAQWLRQLP